MPFRLIFCLVIIGIGLAIASYLKRTAPKASRKPPARPVPLVQVVPLQPETNSVAVHAMGTVVPAREITLKVPVAGKIIEIHPQFLEGGIIREGDLLLQIDPKDYRLALEQKKRAVVDAEYELALELGRQDVARREWNLLYGDTAESDVGSDLALRRPHLQKAQATLTGAKADLAQAEIDLERTSVLAPFNGLIKKKSVDIGTYVAPQETLAELVGTDRYRVQVSLPAIRLKWITVPQKTGDPASSVRVTYRGGHIVSGQVEKLLADLSEEGRMARLLVSVDDPLNLKSKGSKKPPLLLGEYVKATIQGPLLSDTYRIPRSALRDDSLLWIATKDNALEVRRVETLWREEQYVLVRDGLRAGDLLIVSDLAGVVANMPVKVAAPDAKPSEQNTLPASQENHVSRN